MINPVVIYEDNHLLIINKQSGILAQGDKTRDLTALDMCKQYIKEKYNKPGSVFLGLTHRLDRPVSGCLIMARTSKALQRINKSFADGKVEKQYLALTQGQPPSEEGQLTHFLIKDAARNKSKVVSKSTIGAKKAVLTYKLIAFLRPFYLLEVQPQTGRPHQVRVQLSKIGCPIVGDIKYGAPEVLEDQSIALHCHGLRFEHPVKKEMRTVQSNPNFGGVWNPFSGLLPIPFDS